MTFQNPDHTQDFTKGWLKLHTGANWLVFILMDSFMHVICSAQLQVRAKAQVSRHWSAK